MARSSTSNSSEVDEDISPNNVKFETDEAKFSLQPYLFEPIRLKKAPVTACRVCLPYYCPNMMSKGVKMMVVHFFRT
jgi:hypothetical protein